MTRRAPVAVIDIGSNSIHMIVVEAHPGRDLRIRIWRADVGRVPLLLLDSDDPLNSPFDRGITAKLYAGDGEALIGARGQPADRLAQEGQHGHDQPVGERPAQNSHITAVNSAIETAARARLRPRGFGLPSVPGTQHAFFPCKRALRMSTS